MNRTALLAAVWLSGFSLQAQPSADSLIMDFAQPKEYVVAGISISGADYADHNILIAIGGIRPGDRIELPGEAVAQAIRNIWRQALFAHVAVYVDSISGQDVWLRYALQERPRLSGFSFRGTRKSEENELREKINLQRGKVVTDNVALNTTHQIAVYYRNKGFFDVDVRVSQLPDTQQANSVRFLIEVNRGRRVKIDQINFIGNEAFSDSRLKKLMKKTKENTWYPWSVFTVSKFDSKEYEKDKQKILEHYASKGYRDMAILSDTLERNAKGNLHLSLTLREGSKYYFRTITWSGNTKYASTFLDSVLRIKPGDVYNETYLQQRLNGDPRGDDISALYMDDGYLFFRVYPVEVAVANDSVDVEIRIFEGSQASINRVNIQGNTKTHDQVIRRSIRTLPGSKFSRADVIRSNREIASLGFFDPEKLDIRTDPHPDEGTVDLTYVVEEKPSDQVELSAGWGGAGAGVIGSLGLRFNNFSASGIFDPRSWTPLPSGDGQTFSIRFQSTGRRYQSFNISFVEPWLGGRKPNSLSLGTYFSRFTNNLPASDPNFGSLATLGGSVGYGKQLKWPDDFFTLVSSLNIANYHLKNYQANFFITDGNALSISVKETFGRYSSGPDNIFPRYGSNIYLSLAVTPPYSFFSNKDYANLPPEEKYRLIEFHKWRFGAQWFANLTGKLVLHVNAKGGYLGYYNPAIGTPPFERFQVGGDGLSQTYSLYGIDFIAHRGYDVYTTSEYASIFNKYTAELRYPFSTNPSAYVYGMIWGEAANAWYSFSEYDPFQLKRSAGLGLRVYLPIFGIVGFDYGIGFDRTVSGPINNIGDFLNNYGKFSIVLGFEPE
ncbi:MAG: outer membrane protein assembly factor BamA [Chitinophagales bacterium]|nr:outer membrane protein assembly factor BamA [Chitinophagales bacterium]MDW8394198.1 outer membrane protein assembly factor BamA [Chitinophagales bacterium]